jgi:hypothetical protein
MTLNRKLWTCFAAAFLMWGESAAAPLTGSDPVPKRIASLLSELRHCARENKLDNNGRDHFDYCGAPVIWNPSSANLVRPCIDSFRTLNVEQLPSIISGTGITYRILLKCSSYSVLSIEVEDTGRSLWISRIGEVVH